MKQFIFSISGIFIIISIPFALSCNTPQVDLAQKDFNIVLITIDTLRADHLSCYGYERKTSPNIDKIAEKGIIFTNAIAPSSWTSPSMASLFTSLYPTNHGVIRGLGFKGKEEQAVLSDDLITLTEILKAHGYTTFGFSSNLHLDKQFGFARGFDYFSCRKWAPAHSCNQTIYSWKDKIKESEKFFLWIHYVDPHRPYLPRRPWIDQYISPTLMKIYNAEKSRHDNLESLIAGMKTNPRVVPPMIALYDSEINYVDSYIGKIFEQFDLEENTLVIITSDHGEEFLEHDQFGHGNNLYQQTIHIPLIVKLPHHSKKETVTNLVNLLDVMPSILDILNIDSPAHVLGQSLFKKRGPLFWLKKVLLRDTTTEHTFAELDLGTILKAIITPQWKYIYNYENKTEQLYDIKADPLERTNLTTKKAKKCRKLKERLFTWNETAKKYPPKKKHIELSPQDKEKLKNLGYID